MQDESGWVSISFLQITLAKATLSGTIPAPLQTLDCGWRDNTCSFTRSCSYTARCSRGPVFAHAPRF